MANKQVCLCDGSPSAYLTLYKMLQHKADKNVENIALFIDFGQMSDNLVQGDHVSDLAASMDKQVKFANMNGMSLYKDVMVALSQKSLRQLAKKYPDMPLTCVPDMVQRAIVYDMVFRNFRTQASDEHLYIFDNVLNQSTCLSRTLYVTQSFKEAYERPFVHLKLPVNDIHSDEECLHKLESVGYTYGTTFSWNHNIIETGPHEGCEQAGMFMSKVIIPTVRKVCGESMYWIHTIDARKGVVGTARF